MTNPQVPTTFDSRARLVAPVAMALLALGVTTVGVTKGITHSELAWMVALWFLTYVGWLVSVRPVIRLDASAGTLTLVGALSHTVIELVAISTIEVRSMVEVVVHGKTLHSSALGRPRRTLRKQNPFQADLSQLDLSAGGSVRAHNLEVRDVAVLLINQAVSEAKAVGGDAQGRGYRVVWEPLPIVGLVLFVAVLGVLALA